MLRSDSPATRVQTLAQDGAITEAQIYDAIANVLDPELDEPLVKLGFIDRVQVAGPDVTVVFKLPTFWCAPNFAYLMAVDLRNQLRTLPGVRTVHVTLLDHCTDEEITNGINEGRSFVEIFPDEATEDPYLEELRQTFLRKGFLMRQDTLIRQMLKVHLDEQTIATLRLADLRVDEAENVAFVTVNGRLVRLERVGHSAATYLKRRASLGLSLAPDDALIIDDQGRPLQAGTLPEFLRRSRSIRMNIMFNTSLCKGLFRTRYGTTQATADREDEEGDML
jgi:metal-sulfur cluster biosynthetic enzyme